MKKAFTLKQLNKNLKKAQTALKIQRARTKGVETEVIREINKIISNINKEIGTRTNSANAVRSSLPKKLQRKQGLIAPVQ